jgi:sugar transferase EpsL
MSAPNARPYRAKRAFDLAVLAIVALPALLIGLPCALAVRLTSRGPVLFRQERVGRDGLPFVCLKFRTMAHDPNRRTVFPSDDLITPVGHVLRRLSLDELPQLWNVTRGDMSIVGPRPTLAYQVARYTAEQRRRLAVRPGLTGLAQVSGRNAVVWSERIELDLEYIERQSVGLDLAILFRSIGAILGARGMADHPPDDPIAALPGSRTSERAETPG